MRELHDIFDECVDRLANGETIESIVRDYPDHAAELRDWLTLGQIAGRVQMNTGDMDSAHESGRSRLADLIFLSQKDKKEDKMTQEKSKRKIKPITESRWKLPAIAVAGIALLIGGVLIGLFVARRQTIEMPPPQIALATDDACATITSYGQNQQGQMQPTPTPIDIGSVQLTATSLGHLLEPTMPPVVGIASEPGVTPVSVDTEFMPTPAPTGSPFPTMVPASIATIEMPVESRDIGEVGASAESDDAAYGYVGGDTTTTTGSAAMGGEAPPAAPVIDGDGRTRSETSIVYPESMPIVPTSVASMDGYDADESTVEEPVTDGIVDLERDGAVANQVALQPLRAGEIDDNADWDVYQEYRNNYFRQYSPFSVNDRDVTDRQTIRVIDANGLPVLGACVQVYHGTSLITQNRTYATGLTMFFPNLLDNTRYVDTFSVIVSKNDVVEQVTLDRNAIGDTLTVELSINQQPTLQMDVMFLLDATGSMSDEIMQLQENILAISEQIDELNVDARYGLVSYRDFGDEYITRVDDFTTNIDTFQNSLRAVVAGGGGDTPEALNEGLNDALNSVAWRDENTVKLVFLVADAAPHLDYNNGLDYSVLMLDALSRGIKIHPIASSGLTPDGEYILRQIGQVTMGHFIFLTYEGSQPGTSGDDRTDLEVGTPEDEQGVGDYSVAQLDELVLRLITDELAALRGEQ
jgi:hypothetical protein